MVSAGSGAICVVGLLWGDEGKGKIVDVLTDEAQVVVRYNGGANAGHTVVIGSERFALHLLPSGVLQPGKVGVIGPGVVLDPEVVLEEIGMLATRGVDVSDRLVISDRCHLVLPYHKLEDRLSEGALDDADRIGTTARGIGPCYADKMQRTTALRFGDLFCAESFRRRLERIVMRKKTVLTALYGDVGDLDAAAIAEQYLAYGEQLRRYVCDTTTYLHDCLADGRRMLFEGAHGALLDVDHGTYPYVTSSTTGAGGVASGAGIPPAALQTTFGVVKAYATRVGQGPFPTELHDDIGRQIREQGHEYGTTTGRPRRCGWFDAVAVRYAVRVGGVEQLAVMHLDTLSGLKQLKICLAYEIDGQRGVTFPSGAEELETVRPVYEDMPGWSEDITAAQRFEDLPRAAREYVLRLEDLLATNISIISVGPERQQTIFRDSSRQARRERHTTHA